MKKLFTLLLSILLLFSSTGIAQVHAADFRTGDNVFIPEGTTLEDAYLFGNNVRVNAPVTNDAVAAGSDVAINQNVSGSVMTAGGTVTVTGATGNTLRAAGGTIRIDGSVARDVVIAGGSITLTENASVGRDLLAAGGNLIIESPVTGKAVINGGNVTINSTINGNVEGEFDKLTLGPNARITGNLTYKSPEQAQIANGAVVQGKTSYTPIERTQKNEEKAREFVAAGSIYKLVTDIIISILLIYFFGRVLLLVFKRMNEKPVESGAIGFAFIFLFPIAALLLLMLIWLGIGAWLVYGLALLISLYIAKIFIGWLLLRWWQRRNKKEYVLDWKAGIFGPIALFILMYIPIFGWFAAAILFFVAIGAFLHGLIKLLSGQRVAAIVAPKKK